MATSNDITGDAIQSKPSTDLYRDGWERIFGARAKTEPKPDDQDQPDQAQDQ